MGRSRLKSPEDAQATVDKAAIDSEGNPTSGRSSRPARARPYPRRSLEDAIKIASAIKQNNGGNPWPPAEVAKAVGAGGTTHAFYYWTAAARDFGLTEGTRDTAVISLTDLGRRVVYPNSEEDAQASRREAFDRVDLFKRVAEHHGGANPPQDEFVRNTLETSFGLDPRVHDEFIDLFKKSARLAGVGAEVYESKDRATRPHHTRSDGHVGSAKHPTTGHVCFVVMPFVERTDAYATGFFNEVFAHLFKPAIEAAGFEARTAKRQGSDVIHSTIVTELLAADLVLADLTEHNPNVLFELGVRLALDRPTALVRAQGKAAIFDVDNLLRVESYSPNLWPEYGPQRC